MATFTGWATALNTVTTTTGTSGTISPIGEFPGTFCSVFDHGATTLATITPLGNPFAVNADGSFRFVGAASSYDLIFSLTLPASVVAPSTSLADPLPAASGGTGQTVYVIGDLLYADSIATLAKLADVAIGRFLASGGVGVAPAWSTSLDSPTFVIDPVTHRVGFGTASPATRVDVRAISNENGLHVGASGSGTALAVDNSSTGSGIRVDTVGTAAPAIIGASSGYYGGLFFNITDLGSAGANAPCIGLVGQSVYSNGLYVQQGAVTGTGSTLARSNVLPAAYVTRVVGSLNGFDYTGPLLTVEDTTASTGKLISAINQGSEKFSADNTGVANALTALSVGATPATTGDVRLKNTGTIMGRSTVATNLQLLTLYSDNVLYLGDVGVHVLPWSATQDLGSAGLAWRFGYFNSGVSVTALIDPTDPTKKLAISLSGMTTAKTLTLSSAQTTTQTLTVPVIRQAETLAIKPQTYTTLSTPKNPTGTSDTTGKMMGLAGSITPQVTGNVRVTICGSIANNTIADGGKVQIRMNSGSVPSNGDALTGTTYGSLQEITGDLAGANKNPFCISALVTGLTVGTAYWIDVGLAAVTGGTATISSVAIDAFEL